MSAMLRSSAALICRIQSDTNEENKQYKLITDEIRRFMVVDFIGYV